MRILFTFAGGRGHFEPLLPVARAAAAAGHAVAFAGRPRMVPTVEATGFPAFPSGRDEGLTPVTRPLRVFSAEHEARQLAKGFADRLPRERAKDLLPLCAEWQPDLLVCEEMDFGGMIVAERLGLPHATVLVIAAGSFIRPEFVAAPLNAVRADYGLPADPELAMLRRDLVLSPFPPSVRDPADPLPVTAHAFRLDEMLPAAGAAVSPWSTWDGQLAGAPLVYFTLGTVFHVESGDLFDRVLAALRELPINLIVTVGRERDPAAFGPQPANLRIERFIPQATLLPHCHLVVSHAGSGSVNGALAHGLPMVLFPMGADQPLNAARCEALGLGRVLNALEATPDTVRDAVAVVLANPVYRLAAERLRDEIAALPGPASAVSLLERLVADRPLPGPSGRPSPSIGRGYGKAPLAQHWGMLLPRVEGGREGAGVGGIGGRWPHKQSAPRISR